MPLYPGFPDILDFFTSCHSTFALGYTYVLGKPCTPREMPEWWRRNWTQPSINYSFGDGDEFHLASATFERTSQDLTGAVTANDAQVKCCLLWEGCGKLLFLSTWHTTSGMLCVSSCTRKMVRNLSEGHGSGLGSTSLEDVMHKESLEGFFSSWRSPRWIWITSFNSQVRENRDEEPDCWEGHRNSSPRVKGGKLPAEKWKLALPWQWWSMGTEPLGGCETPQNHGLLGISRDFSRPSSPTPFFF